MTHADKEKALALYFRERVRDQQALNVVMSLLTTVGHIARGAYTDACQEKQAQGYRGVVSIAREGLDVAIRLGGKK